MFLICRAWFDTLAGQLRTRSLTAHLSAATICALSFVAKSQAQAPPLVHMVRRHETLASIAKTYYGNAQLEKALVAENSLEAKGGTQIATGTHLIVPAVRFHRVKAGESWRSLAVRFYGQSRRTFVLVEANGGSKAQPDVGAEIVVPYPLRHVSDAGETYTHIAKEYLGDEALASAIKRFNGITRNRTRRGQLVLVPHAALTLSEEGRSIYEKAHTTTYSGGAVQKFQSHAQNQIKRIKGWLARGEYVRSLALASELAANDGLTLKQRTTTLHQRATCYVALGEVESAERDLRQLLKLQPKRDFSPRASSPKLLKVWRRVKATR